MGVSLCMLVVAEGKGMSMRPLRVHSLVHSGKSGLLGLLTRGDREELDPCAG